MSESNRIALITGVGSLAGIGYATARLLIESNIKIAISDIAAGVDERAAELRALGGDVKAYRCDLTSRRQVAEMVAKVTEDFGSLDILVNCAGMIAPGMDWSEATLADLDPTLWDRDLAINLGTNFNVTQAVLKGMINQNYGRIVHVSSITGTVVSNPGMAAYGAAKAAIVGYSRSLAIEVGKYNITVNSVAPGWIKTGQSMEEEMVGAENTPMARPGSTTEVGEAIRFLASEGASYITGQVLVVDGGNIIQEYKGPKEIWY